MSDKGSRITIGLLLIGGSMLHFSKIINIINVQEKITVS
jgi:hypothetical protein